MSENLEQNVPDQPVGAETAPTPEPADDNSAASDGSAVYAPAGLMGEVENVMWNEEMKLIAAGAPAAIVTGIRLMVMHGLAHYHHQMQQHELFKSLRAE